MNLSTTLSSDTAEWLIQEARRRNLLNRKGEAAPGLAAAQILEECRIERRNRECPR